MLKSLFLTFCLLPLVGCAGRGSLPKTFPSDMKNWDGKLYRVEFLQDFNITDYSRVRVDAVTSTASLPSADSNTYEPVQKVIARATDHFTAGVRNAMPEKKVDNDYRSSGKTLIIHTSVTELDPGSVALRFWVSFGAGASKTEMKGEVTDAATGRTLLRFESTDKDMALGSLGIEGYEGLLAGSIERCGKSVGGLLNAFTPVK